MATEEQPADDSEAQKDVERIRAEDEAVQKSLQASQEAIKPTETEKVEHVEVPQFQAPPEPPGVSEPDIRVPQAPAFNLPEGVPEATVPEVPLEPPSAPPETAEADFGLPEEGVLRTDSDDLGVPSDDLGGSQMPTLDLGTPEMRVRESRRKWESPQARGGAQRADRHERMGIEDDDTPDLETPQEEPRKQWKPANLDLEDAMQAGMRDPERDDLRETGDLAKNMEDYNRNLTSLLRRMQEILEDGANEMDEIQRRLSRAGIP